jgi:hypothetical protein
LEGRPFRVGVFIQTKDGDVNGGKFVVVDVIVFFGKDIDNVFLGLCGAWPNRFEEC